MTEIISRRWQADRTLALVGYGLLFSAIFFAGVTGLVAAVLAYAVKDQASADIRPHFDRQIGIFWVSVILGVLASLAGAAAVIVLLNSEMLLTVGDRVILEGADDMPGLWFLAFIAISVVLWLVTALWVLCASALGFIRLATSDAGA